MIKQPLFLPMTREEMRDLGWDSLDILLVSGDAYVDHPSFGIALLGRHLVGHGYRVGIAAQPRWQDPADAAEDLCRMGRPRLLAGVSAGAVDSMLARYTAFRKMRHDDAYTPGGQGGARPNRAVLVYCGLVRRLFPDLPLVIGGIEASLRRISHYDFWSDSLRRSILPDSKADLLLYGMGESALLAAAQAAEAALESTSPAGDHAPKHSVCRTFQSLARHIPGTAAAISAKEAEEISGAIRLPSHEAILADKRLIMTATLALERQVHQGVSPAVQVSGERAVLINVPAPPLSTRELDALYDLPFARLPHPSYTQPVPAWEMIRTSITSHRGCGGGCAFCSLALHQSRRIASRSRESILSEARIIAAGSKKWAGSISDVGGPSANTWEAKCTLDPARCARPSCFTPSVCPGFAVDQKANADLLREITRQPGVRHVRVASGVRFDLAMRDADALAAYTQEFTGGQLKVAPEHIDEAVLRLMRKPSLAVFERFLEAFAALSAGAGKEQYVIPYLISAYPGCTEEHMRRLAAWLARRNWRPQQVQCFVPTPGTVATAMFYAGADPEGNAIPVARSDAERLRQHYMLLGKQEHAPGARPARHPMPGKASRQSGPTPSGPRQQSGVSGKTSGTARKPARKK